MSVRVRETKAQGLGASEIAKALKIGRASVDYDPWRGLLAAHGVSFETEPTPNAITAMQRLLDGDTRALARCRGGLVASQHD